MRSIIHLAIIALLASPALAAPIHVANHGDDANSIMG